ncbi:hypothetical protein Ccel_2767 [Ruminiclostridium cellulolyticum H10]|uniref:Uncharacterized protein n=1 Tax=Ruminiclostridium cellulolyticum (strain ATCC 35319 / DSM 5812 / JCM 6584 / H10) TaxID=394503 RepID=B8I7J4_RUMCH|nr:hypothetical protein Ccel_2767 [Ruminiclostridium cellulolyticum H10]
MIGISERGKVGTRSGLQRYDTFVGKAESKTV